MMLHIKDGFEDENEKVCTQSPTMTIESIPGGRTGRLTQLEYTSTRANVELHGTTKPIAVIKKLQVERIKADV
ncbi:UNVERIFIED_CONTAM: hypothetical protein Sradi_0659100 [Sesamum radiatum]|uniref:Uncharacterized protein n=1 Tax=Sesamum radiatum TaxID=300843 RepID=A0AAW2VR93_SESRA